MITRDDRMGMYRMPSLIENPETTVFLDIETTGLSAHVAGIFLIGLYVWRTDGWHRLQWFAQRPLEEMEMLKAVRPYLEAATCLVTFNGTTFDIPFIQKSMKQYGMPAWAPQSSLDLFRALKPYKTILGMERGRQRDFEERLGVCDRAEDLAGEALVQAYKDYVENPSEDILEQLLAHNRRDMDGMMAVLAVAGLADLVHGDVTPEGYEHKDGTTTIHMRTAEAFPFSLEYAIEDMQINLSGEQIRLTVPVVEGKMRMYYSPVKDYVYLPLEDRAIHKTLASFVNSGYKVKATKDTCYGWESVENCLSERGFARYWKAACEHLGL